MVPQHNPSRELPAETFGGTTGQSPRGQVERIEAPATIVLADGRRLPMQGLELPAQAARPEGAAARLLGFLRERLTRRVVELHLDILPRDEQIPGAPLGLATVTLPGETESVNRQVLAAGLAVLSARSREVHDFAGLTAAAAQARAAGAGLWSRGRKDRQFASVDAMPFLNGAVLGMHYREERYDYHRQLDELDEMGFTHLELLITAFVPDVEAREILLDRPRTVTNKRLLETIRYAKAKGFTISLLPILLLEESNDDDWRGLLRPPDEELFFLSYERFLVRWLDIAEATGCEMVAIGSELGSLEDSTETWERLIAISRGRFGGLISYSSNWDHVHKTQFLRSLDVIGMTAYFSLTKSNEPSRAVLASAWRRVGAELVRTLDGIDKPIVFTELGYASQQGINKDPWNYFIAVDDIDVEEQADCFHAFLDVIPEFKWLRGAYFYDYFDPGGLKDSGYSPRGKPAVEAWRQWAKYDGANHTGAAQARSQAK